jgi:Na+:H+ antiporter, NhaA family
MEEPVQPTWSTSDRFIPAHFVRPIQAFIRTETASGVVMLAAAVVAMLWANSPWWESYTSILTTEFVLQFGPITIEEDLLHLINDGLMAIFFFVVGLEIKRELAVGELRNPRVAALPAIAALGGMVLPALIFAAVVAGGPGADGWGIPMATDIAFSLGVAALLGRRVPIQAKLFLLALALADDIGAIVVIAIFYTDGITWGFLAAGVGGLVVTRVANRIGIRALGFYLAVGVVVWYCMLRSGVHATLAGVALGLLTPARPLLAAEDFDRRARNIVEIYPTLVRGHAARERIDHEVTTLAWVAKESVAPVNRLQRALVVWSSFVIVPLFALANAGVRFVGLDVGGAIMSPVALGVGLGLVVGKTVGIPAATWVAVRLGIASLPPGLTWRHVIGLGAIAGIGFTVALFVAGLAFPVGSELRDIAKLGIFAGSILSGWLGLLILRSAPEVADVDHDEVVANP